LLEPLQKKKNGQVFGSIEKNKKSREKGKREKTGGGEKIDNDGSSGM
jgi:hypothetical protein